MQKLYRRYYRELKRTGDQYAVLIHMNEKYFKGEYEPKRCFESKHEAPSSNKPNCNSSNKCGRSCSMNNKDEQEAGCLLILLTIKRGTFWCSRHYKHIRECGQPAGHDSWLSFSKHELKISSSSE
jgi:hypothetical protein